MSQHIKTNIKFNKGLGNVESKLYGLVTKINGSWRGCREDAESKKKIVFVDPSIAKDIVPNVLYSCSLIPMHNQKGFIAKTATPVRFNAVIVSECKNGVYEVRVKFGNKTVRYNALKDPNNKKIQEIASDIRARIDLKDPAIVAEDFITTACYVRHLYQQSNNVH